ncbi:MAG TPA: hypothetical protein VHC18_03520 [Amycolatopsis sp.]|nr:hypothetical protein [Amycolatopsis sp.]
MIKNNKPAAAIVGIEKPERLQRVEEFEKDLELLAMAVVRAATDTGRRVSTEDAAARFGADLDGAERKLVFKALRKLRTEPDKRGVPLGSELTTFRKLVVGNRQFRIVFRVEPDGTVVVVWVVASRVDSECRQLTALLRRAVRVASASAGGGSGSPGRRRTSRSTGR